MSLHHAAQHLAAQGRGPDTTLVHMTPGEVRGLQSIAKAHGGSLTINPQTGLPEAGFLSRILPTIAGVGLSMIPGVGPLAAAGIVGGLQTARTGSLQKGLMAGLGAYGGASIGQNLSALGTSQAADAATANMQMNPLEFESTVAAQQQANAIQAAREAAIKTAQSTPFETMGKGISTAFNEPSKFMNTMTTPDLIKSAGAAVTPMMAMETTEQPEIKTDNAPADRMIYNAGVATPFPQPDVFGYDNLGQDFGRQQNYFPYSGFKTPVPGQKRFAKGGYAAGGLPVEQMSQANAVGMNTGYPQADITGHAYATPWQTPVSQNVVSGAADTGVNRMTGQMLATGGISDAHYNLGGYSDGGRLLRGPGDGVSDSIPATIGNRQPARLADGEFVVPARIVSELGNGSTEAGARKLYGMMDRVQKARGKTVGKGKVAKNTRADKFLPA